VKPDIYGGKDPRRIPAYTIAEAARYLHLPVATLRAWVLGQAYAGRVGPRRFRPVVQIADPGRKLLSFLNLAEAHVLSALRREQGVSLQKVRQALDYLGRSLHLSSDHPLAEHRFATDGVHLFVEHYSQLIEVTQEGQLAIGECLERYLTRVEWDDHGLASRLYPFTHTATATDSPRVVIIDPTVAFGRPVLTGSRIGTSVVVERWMAGESVDTLAEDYGRAPGDIEEAIRWHVLKAA
jgi:uncharacterized protein (DUF433 family)/DNA-binding transcriptional MerR regulator